MTTMVHGVKPVLEVLRRIEPDLYKQISKDIKDKVEPVRAGVAQGFPDRPWTSSKKIQWVQYGRTTRGRKPKGSSGASFPKYDGKKARKGVTVQIGGRKVRRTNTYPIVRIKQSDAAGQIYDLAKNNRTAGKQSFVQNLNRSGSPSRVMWKRVRSFVPLVTKDLTRIVSSIEKQFTAEIAHESQRRANSSMRARSQNRNAFGRFGL
jgi:hypothetical protein